MSKRKFNSESLRPFINMDGLKGDEVVERKQYISEIKVMEDEERTVVAKISTTATDADQDIVDPSGAILTRFLKNPVIHADHSYKVEDVIGRATELAVSTDGITAKIKFADVTQRARDCWELVKGGWVRANSIGFIALKSVIRGTKEFDEYVKGVSYKVGTDCNRIITSFELLESSVVSIPSNPLSLMQAISAKSINLSPETITALDLDKVVKNDIPATVIVQEPVIDVKEVKKVCPVCGEDDCDGDCQECNDYKCPGYALYLDSKKPKAVVEPVVVAPVIPVIEPVIESPKSYLKVLRHGGIDIQAEIEKEKAKQAGKIV